MDLVKSLSRHQRVDVTHVVHMNLYEFHHLTLLRVSITLSLYMVHLQITEHVFCKLYVAKSRLNFIVLFVLAVLSVHRGFAILAMNSW